MSLGKGVLLYAASFVVFLAIDAVWLTAMGGYYRRSLGSLMAERPNLAVALAFYLLYVLGVLVLVVLPAHDAASFGRAVLTGALFGAVAYGTYDLTNLSTLAGWPVAMTVIDIAWGTTLTAAVSTAGYLIASRLG